MPQKGNFRFQYRTFLRFQLQTSIKDSLKNAKILSWPAPKNVSEVRQILGMGSYYRRFIKDFSLMVKPLTELYSTVKSNAERISTHLAILPLGSLRLKSQISAW
jgi:hypothetical protein